MHVGCNAYIIDLRAGRVAMADKAVEEPGDDLVARVAEVAHQNEQLLVLSLSVMKNKMIIITLSFEFCCCCRHELTSVIMSPATSSTDLSLLCRLLIHGENDATRTVT